MAKIVIVFLFVISGILQTHAQVTFRPGVRGGANFSHFTKGNDYYSDNSTSNNFNYGTHTDFYIGFYGALKLSKFYTLQPEFDYSAQGSGANTKELNVDYLSVELLNKFTFNDKFNIHFGPTLDFVVSKDFNTEADADMAFVLGAGYNFTPNFGIETRVKKGIINVYYDDVNHTNVVFSLGVNYTFDVK
ncbi:MAG: porin family protein [Flavobacterium sp.]|nr:porin family protein [Flavobacterium sp.]